MLSSVLREKRLSDLVQDHVDLMFFAGFDHLHKARPRGILDGR